MSMGTAQKMGYTIKQKIDICLMAEANPEMTQADLAKWAKKKYHTTKPPSQTTISRILSKKTELISLKEHEFRLIRRRKPSNVLLREILTEWISQSVWDNIPITTSIIQNSATTLWKILPVNSKEGNGEFSHKWCNHFLSKMNVTLSNLENELVKPGKIWDLENERYQLKAYLRQFSLKDIFALDEFFLYYKLPLDKKYVSNEMFNTNNNNNIFLNKNGVTVLLTTNADGSEKLEPLLLGHYENMNCFDGKPPSKIANKYAVNYKSDKKAWLTSLQFSNWLSTLDKRLSLANRHIVLVLDDAAGHRIVNMKLDYIKLVFVHNPNNDTKSTEKNDSILLSNRKKILPLEMGIFREFKVLYRLQQYLLSLSLQLKLGNSQILLPDQYSISMVDVMIMTKNAWANVSVEVIRNAWINSDIIDLEVYVNQQFDSRTNNAQDSDKSNDKQGIWGDGSNDDHKNFNQTASLTQNTATDFKNSEFKLLQMIRQLNVNEPWDLRYLTNLSFEDKFLNYQTPTEMVDACMHDEYEPSNGVSSTAKTAGNSVNASMKEPFSSAAASLSESYVAGVSKNENAQVKQEKEVQLPSSNNPAEPLNNDVLDNADFGDKTKLFIEQYDSYFNNFLPENDDFKFSFGPSENKNDDKTDFSFFDIGKFDYSPNDNSNTTSNINSNNSGSNNNNFGINNSESNNNSNNQNNVFDFDMNDNTNQNNTSPTNFFNFDTNNNNNNSSYGSQLQYNQHVNRYTANSLYSAPVKKGNLSSVITIPDNSHSFGVLYSKKRKVSSLENSENDNNMSSAAPSSLFNSPSGRGEPLSKSDSLNSHLQLSSKNSSAMSSPNALTIEHASNNNSRTTSGSGDFLSNLTAKKKATLLSAVITTATNGGFQLSENCLQELRSQMLNQMQIAQQEKQNEQQYFNTNNYGNENPGDLLNLTEYLAQTLELNNSQS